MASVAMTCRRFCGLADGGAGHGLVPVSRGLVPCAGMVLPGCGVRGRVVMAGSADGGEEPEVVGGAGEQELAGGVVEAAQAEAAQPAVVFEAGVEAFDVGGAALVSGAALGGAQPAGVGRHGAVICGGLVIFLF